MVRADFTEDEQQELARILEGDMPFTAIESVDEVSFFLSERANALKKEVEQASYYAQREISYGANEAEKSIKELGTPGPEHILEEIKYHARIDNIGYAAKIIEKYTSIYEPVGAQMQAVLAEYILARAQKSIDSLPLDRVADIDAAYGAIATLLDDEAAKETIYAALNDTVLQRAIRLCEARQEKQAKDFINYYSSDAEAMRRMLEVLDATVFKTAIGMATEGINKTMVEKYVCVNASTQDTEAMMLSAVGELY